MLAARPTAAIFIRLRVDPPPWWLKNHPDECVGYCDGDIDASPDVGDEQRGLRHSMASETWRNETTAKLIEFCRHLARMPEGESLVGLHVGGGVYGQWHYWGFQHEPDSGPSMTACFRRWLLAKYQRDEALQAAWNDSRVTLASARVPNIAARQRSTAGVFRNPAKERNVIDYYECQHAVVADNVLHFCRTAKESWPRPMISGASYGYFLSMPVR